MNKFNVSPFLYVSNNWDYLEDKIILNLPKTLHELICFFWLKINLKIDKYLGKT